MIQPHGPRVLVKPDPAIETSPSGLLFLPNPKQNPYQSNSTGTIVAVGSRKSTTDGSDIPLESKVGDRVMFGKHMGTEMDTAEHGKCILMLEEYILAKMEA